MKTRLLTYLKDDFLRHNVIFFVGSIVVAILNYAYHPIMSRMMSVEDFGEIQVLFSIFSQVSVPLAIFNIIALNLYANKLSPTGTTIRQFSLLTFYTAAATGIALLIATPILVSSLKLSSAWEIIVIIFTLIVTSITIFGKAYLQAAHRFTLTSIVNAIGAGGKLLVAVILVWLGFGVAGALGGLFIAALASFFFVFKYAKNFMALPQLERLRLTPELKNEIYFGVIVLFGTGLITFLSTADVIFAKFLFTPEDAGLYSGISVVGRIIFFATASIAGVLLTHITLKATPEENHNVLRQGLIFTALIGGVGLIIFSVVPKLIITLMVGGVYSESAHLLPLLSLYIFIVSLINICISFGIALRQKSVIIVGIVGIVSTSLLVTILPPTSEGLIYAFLGGSLATFLVCFYTIFIKNPVYGPSTH